MFLKHIYNITMETRRVPLIFPDRVIFFHGITSYYDILRHFFHLISNKYCCITSYIWTIPPIFFSLYVINIYHVIFFCKICYIFHMKIVNVEFLAPNINRYCVINVWREKWRHFHPKHSRGNLRESLVFKKGPKRIVADS